ncbi:hypothetical protein EJ06DRAFT_556319 [Trichodelitschia bisporula]|uniref:SEC7 domain-containing protein n=1 Tax=Trichodelitschia bisporula TaxID=703511 RepID=A0A6G1HY39_9PEZI|nr:hypothetical protein EJ06DRAFT_556319 [Trichodelitschia bisporula]
MRDLRMNRSERDLRRRSTLETINIFRPRDPADSTSAAPTAATPTQLAVLESGAVAARAASIDIPRQNDVVRGRALLPAFDTPLDEPPAPRASGERRFGLLKWRHASDPQLSAKAKEHAAREADADVPPVPAVPPTPAIITTAPTLEPQPQPQPQPESENPILNRRKSRFYQFTRPKVDGPVVVEPRAEDKPERRKMDHRKSRFAPFRSMRGVTADELRQLAESRASDHGPTSTSFESQKSRSSGALPLTRKSESARSEMDSLEGGSDMTSPQRPHARTVPSSSTFPWLARRNRNRASLFPLPPREDGQSPFMSKTAPATPRPSMGAVSSTGSPDGSPRRSNQLASPHRVNGHTGTGNSSTSVTFAPPNGVLRNDSVRSSHSTHSSPTLVPPNMSTLRARSSTLGSNSGRSDDPPPTPPWGGSGRTSTSTVGRSSLSNLFGLSHRFRHGSDPHSPRQGSPGRGVHTPGFASTASMSVPLPERQDGETPIQYLSRIEDVMHKSQIPSVLSKSGDDFLPSVMRSFMRKFAFFGDPLDMAIRKLLMEIDLPRETQQIDRVLQSFADRYHECNPGIFPEAGKAYFIAFSILILQTDAFNKNNKRKMTKADYIKNSSIEGVSDDALDCFYDNTVYTPFIRVEDELDHSTLGSRKNRRAARVLKSAIPEAAKKPTKEPLDPYALIFENKLDTLRPQLRDVMFLEDPYSYLGTAPSLDKSLLHLTKAGVIQIESSRSRPDAFMSPSGIENPDEAKAGVVDLPVDKVGVLWRKDPKKKTARSPWQEWGAILTGGGLYFFKNATSVKGFVHQYENHVRMGQAGQPCVFKPTLSHFKADHVLPTEHGVALMDTTYRKHKNAFIFFRLNGAEEVFLADNEQEMNDWLVKLNHQAAFKTAGIRQRGLVGGHYDGQRQRGMRRLESSNSNSNGNGTTVQTPTGEVTIQSGKIDHNLAAQISAARRDGMTAKIEEAEASLEEALRKLDAHLRDARHLLILAPIQPKTREAIVHAAERLADQLKWSRIEIWRMKCHRDILAMDLEEEKREAQRRQARIDRLAGKPNSIASQSSSSTTKPHLHKLERFASSATITTSSAPTSSAPTTPRPSRSPTRPETGQSSSSIASTDDFRTPPELTPAATPTTTTATAPLAPTVSAPTPADLTIRPPRRASTTPAHMPDDMPSPTLSEYRTPILTDEQAARWRESRDSAAYFTPRTPPRPGADEDAADDELPPITPGSPESRKRRLARSLRESGGSGGSGGLHSHALHGRRKHHGKSESFGSAAGDEAAELRREGGSFTVHGKKASVVTFGGDWADLGDPAKRREVLGVPDGTEECAVEEGESEHPAAVAIRDRRPSAASVRSGSGVGRRSAGEEERRVLGLRVHGSKREKVKGVGAAVAGAAVAAAAVGAGKLSLRERRAVGREGENGGVNEEVKEEKAEVNGVAKDEEKEVNGETNEEKGKKGKGKEGKGKEEDA